MKIVASNKAQNAFSLIELLISFALAGFILGSIGYLVTSSITSRQKSVFFNQLVLLASQKMNEIKHLKEEKEESNDYDGFPNYRYEYSIKEEELNLLELAKDAGLEDLLPEDDPTLKYLEQRQNNLSDANEIGVFKLLHYQVIVRYKKRQQYILNFYRSQI